MASSEPVPVAGEGDDDAEPAFVSGLGDADVVLTLSLCLLSLCSLRYSSLKNSFLHRSHATEDDDELLILRGVMDDFSS